MAVATLTFITMTFVDHPNYHAVFFSHVDIDLDKLPLSTESKYYIRGSDLVRFRICAEKIYCDDSFRGPQWQFYNIVRWCIQENDLSKIKALTDMIYDIDRAWLYYDIVMYWAWELRQYKIFAWSWYAFLHYHHEDELAPILVVSRDQWPEELVDIFEASVHVGDSIHASCWRGDEIDLCSDDSSDEDKLDLLYTARKEKLSTAMLKKYPNIPAWI